LFKGDAMVRYFAWATAAFLMLTGVFLLWQGSAENASALPAAPKPRAATPFNVVPPTLEAPASTPKTREQKRFGRADKDDDGRITQAELFDPRRKAFAKLDLNGNGALSFEEWAEKTLTKFASADKDRSGWLSPTEYATTAPPPPKAPKCGC
jgi:hypothetical protein